MQNEPTAVELAQRELVKVTAPMVGTYYRHYKGGLYFVQAVAVHETTAELMVAYRNLMTGDCWVRPLAQWAEEVELPGGGRGPRFSLYTGVSP